MKTLIAFFFMVTAATFAHGESSYRVVRQMLINSEAPKDPIALSEFQTYQNHQLPHYAVNMQSVFQYGAERLLSDARRTLSDSSDYFQRLPKLLHPNGVCVLGDWLMNPASIYSGAFAPGRKLFIGRISVAMQEVERGEDRGFGFAGKIFPTEDPDLVVPTANFFTVDVLMGAKTPRFLDTATTNEPELGFNFSLIGLGLKIANTLSQADSHPGFRPVKNLAQLGVVAGQPIRSPRWIRLLPAAHTLKNDQADFRNEIIQALQDNQELVFHVEGSDTTGDRLDNGAWNYMGEIHIHEAVVSYGCDRQLHFAHPHFN